MGIVWDFQHLIINKLTRKMELNVELVWEVFGVFSGEVKNNLKITILKCFKKNLLTPNFFLLLVQTFLAMFLFLHKETSAFRGMCYVQLFHKKLSLSA